MCGTPCSTNSLNRHLYRMIIQVWLESHHYSPVGYCACTKAEWSYLDYLILTPDYSRALIHYSCWTETTWGPRLTRPVHVSESYRGHEIQDNCCVLGVWAEWCDCGIVFVIANSMCVLPCVSSNKSSYLNDNVGVVQSLLEWHIWPFECYLSDIFLICQHFC